MEPLLVIYCQTSILSPHYWEVRTHYLLFNLVFITLLLKVIIICQIFVVMEQLCISIDGLLMTALSSFGSLKGCFILNALISKG